MRGSPSCFSIVVQQQFDRAIADYREGIRLCPDLPPNYYSLAWLLATCPKSEFRDGEKAVEYAKKGLQAVPGRLDQEGFNGLAAAYAETGNFKEAVECMRKALREPGVLAQEEMRARLQLYEQGKPYREKP